MLFYMHRYMMIYNILRDDFLKLTISIFLNLISILMEKTLQKPQEKHLFISYY